MVLFAAAIDSVVGRSANMNLEWADGVQDIRQTVKRYKLCRTKKIRLKSIRADKREAMPKIFERAVFTLLYLYHRSTTQ